MYLIYFSESNTGKKLEISNIKFISKRSLENKGKFFQWNHILNLL